MPMVTPLMIGVPMVDQREHISVMEASKLCGLHRKTIRRYVDTGALAGFRLPTGGRRVWHDSAVALLANRGPGRARTGGVGCPVPDDTPADEDLETEESTWLVMAHTQPLLAASVYQELADRARTIGAKP